MIIDKSFTQAALLDFL